MENELIKALRASSIATEDKNKAVLNALEYAQKCDREQIEWNNKFQDALTFKGINDPSYESVIWAGVALSVIVCLAGTGIKIWNFGL